MDQVIHVIHHLTLVVLKYCQVHTLLSVVDCRLEEFVLHQGGLRTSPSLALATNLNLGETAELLNDDDGGGIELLAGGTLVGKADMADGGIVEFCCLERLGGAVLPVSFF